MSAPLRLGTRSSRLALAQSSLVAVALERAHPGLRVELVPLVTRGDRYPGDLAEVGGKGLFTEELEAGLADGSIDLAVHSLKDLPVYPPEELAVAAYPARIDPRDLLISDGAPRLANLPHGARVLTGSLRRRALLLAARPDLRVLPVRGNIDTRLAKWRRGDGDAVVLAASGVERLRSDAERSRGAGLDELPAHPLNPLTEMLPAPGQGTLALQTRRQGPAFDACAALDHPSTRAAATAERILVAALGGDCTLPLAAWARYETSEAAPTGDGGELMMDAVLAHPDGATVDDGGAAHRADGRGFGATPEATAQACLAAMEANGVQDLLARLRPEA